MVRQPPETVAKPRLLFRPDPVLGWSLTPGYSVDVRYRDGVIQKVDADGWRHIPRGIPPAGPRIAFYGCSFTYGTGLRDEETFTALLQATYPDLHIVNRGIGGHGSVQNYLQLRRDIAAGAVDAAVFAILSHHRFRNIPHPNRMRQYLSREWSQLGVEHVPLLQRDARGRCRIVYFPIWQPALERGGFDAFLPDEWMITDATLAALDLVRAEAEEAKLPLAFVLLDALAPRFNAAVRAKFEACLDISVPLDAAHTFLPHDGHPNARANALYAARLEPVVDSLRNRLERAA